MSVVTIQTLAVPAQKMPENKHALDYLEEYGAIFGQAIRKGYSERNKIGKTDKKVHEGSKNYQGGNQLVRYDVDKRTLTITVTPSLREKYGNRVTLHSIIFPRGEA